MRRRPTQSRTGERVRAEVMNGKGEWIDAPPVEGAFVVNIGDMLELWSGGRLKSTPHRVVNRSGHERYSFPYFAVPRHDVVVAPLIDCQPLIVPFVENSATCAWKKKFPKMHIKK